jgi:hypothetical protein
MTAVQTAAHGVLVCGELGPAPLLRLPEGLADGRCVLPLPPPSGVACGSTCCMPRQLTASMRRTPDGIVARQRAHDRVDVLGGGGGRPGAQAG